MLQLDMVGPTSALVSAFEAVNVGRDRVISSPQKYLAEVGYINAISLLVDLDALAHLLPLQISNHLSPDQSTGTSGKLLQAMANLVSDD